MAIAYLFSVGALMAQTWWWVIEGLNRGLHGCIGERCFWVLMTGIFLFRVSIRVPLF